MSDLSVDSWRARIRDSQGRIFGAGVLVAPHLVVTCAHVVARALQVPSNGTRPASPVSVDFPTATHLGRCDATVIDGGWVAMADDFFGDLALLQLAEPRDISVASFAPCGVPWRRPIRVFGHPRTNADIGEWATGDMTGTAGPSGEWVQINSGQFGPRITGGYSGAGVVDENGAVIGLLIASDSNAANRGAWMVTAEAMARLLPAFATEVGDLRPAVRRSRERATAPLDAGRLQYEMQVVEILLGLDLISFRETRDTLVRHLERLLGRSLAIPRDEQARADLLNIVVACLDESMPDGLESLADVIDLVHGTSTAGRALRRLAIGDPRRRLTSLDVDRLGLLLANSPPAAVADAAHTAFGVMGRRRDVPPADHAELLRALAELSGPAGEPPPVLVLLNRLSELTDPPVQVALRQWLTTLAERWELSPDELTFPVPTGPARPLRSALVVELQEDGPDPNTYLLSITVDHDNGDRTPLFIDDQPLALDEVPGHLGLQLRRVTGQALGPVGALTIEFVLPYELIGHPVDQWRISVGSNHPLPIGAQYSVVVRSRDRLHSPIYQHRWATRWRHLLDHRWEPNARAVGFIQLTGNTAQALLSGMENLPEGFTDDYPVCLVLALPMPRRGNDDRGGALVAAVERGVPVLIWCRLPRANSQFLVDMANHLRNRAIGEIPELVQRLRTDATVPLPTAEHLGRHISLLWDDYDRLAPTTAFRAPLQGGSP